jgi:hypothetical protein
MTGALQSDIFDYCKTFTGNNWEIRKRDKIIMKKIIRLTGCYLCRREYI